MLLLSKPFFNLLCLPHMSFDFTDHSSIIIAAGVNSSEADDARIHVVRSFENPVKR